MAAKTDLENFDLTQIPLEGEKRIGRIFREGEIKYDRNNWRQGVFNKKYQLERMNHALKHLKIYIHWLEHGEYLGEIKNGIMEDDLAKVGWAVLTQCELERMEALTPAYEVDEKTDEPSFVEEEKEEAKENIPVKEAKKNNVFTKLLKGD